ncbi:MAG: aminopeptidase P family protein [Eubacterium sp.]|nr:aminopeptidase P family protein [Eubacterium sp.]
MKKKIDRTLLQKILEDAGVDAILITDPYSLRYYTGFKGGEGIAVVTRERYVLITDSRYTEAATLESEFEVEGFSAARTKKEIITDIFKKDNIASVGFEDDSISYSNYKAFENILSSEELSHRNLMLKALDGKLLEPRRVKTEEEIEYLRQAEHIGDMAFNDILGILKPGMTELEVAAELEYRMKCHGAEGFSFDTIAASGVHSSMPHAIPTDKKLEDGDFLTLDFGCLYGGYCSDMTRTVCIGKADDEKKAVYNKVLEAQLAVLDAVKPGLVCKDVDAIARNIIRDAGYGSYFGHGLGHSVGLFIHESPAFNTRDETVLQAGMVITDEPGIYLPGRFGVRIEDMILITEEGYENLAHSPKGLIEL